MPPADRPVDGPERSVPAVDNHAHPGPGSAPLPHRGARRGPGSLEAAPGPGVARVRWAMLAGGVLASGAGGAGTGGPPPPGPRPPGDEPQYLLTAISLARDGDLDIADELAEGAWRPFHALPLPEQTVALDGGRGPSPHDPPLPG